jgi:hypothetical protein
MPATAERLIKRIRDIPAQPLAAWVGSCSGFWPYRKVLIEILGQTSLSRATPSLVFHASIRSLNRFPMLQILIYDAATSRVAAAIDCRRSWAINVRR